MILGAAVGALLARTFGARALWLVSMAALVTLFIPCPLQLAVDGGGLDGAAGEIATLQCTKIC